MSTNVRPCQKSRGNECPWERMSVHRVRGLRELGFTLNDDDAAADE